MPPPAPVAAPTGPAQEARTGWSALVGADRDFFQSHGADVTAGLAFPEGLQPREVALCGPEVVVGRRNAARGYFPDIDLSSPVNDPAVSRRHVILRQQPDGTWELVDQHPVNGTWVNGAAAPLPAGSVIPLHDGDRVHLGAFSVLQVRRNGRAAS